jgi:hypothetical protein
MWRRILLVVALNTTCIVSTWSASPSVYTGIPAGFDFPAPQERLMRAVETEDVQSQRKHAWNVFAGLTSNSGGIPVWTTWYSARDVFRPSGGLKSSGFEFHRSRLHYKDGSEEMKAPLKLAETILYNREAALHIRKNCDSSGLSDSGGACVYAAITGA